MRCACFSAIMGLFIMAASLVGCSHHHSSAETNFAPTNPGPATLTNFLGMTFVAIPPGTFMMGSKASEPGREDDEIRHEVTLTREYYLQTTPVTQGQWTAVMGSNPSSFPDCGLDCPVDTVTWYDVQAFIEKLNASGEVKYRLPTEAEWEYAARAGSTTAFASGPIRETGDGYDPVLYSMGWYKFNSKFKTHPVAQKKPNAWGLYDMHGNVWEWVANKYGPYPASPVTDPQGAAQGQTRVLRGGALHNDARFCRSASRHQYPPDGRYYSLGFRLVISVR